MTNTPDTPDNPSAKETLSPFEALKLAFKYAFRWSGRASRPSFWWVQVFIIPTSIITSLNSFNIQVPDFIYLISMIIALVFLIPSISLTVRRLHDINMSGWWWWIQVIPIAGIIVLFVLMLLPGKNNNNRYGPDPEGRISDSWVETTGVGGISVEAPSDEAPKNKIIPVIVLVLGILLACGLIVLLTSVA